LIGAGKSTALKQAIRLWKNKKVLVIVFNKSNQEALQIELKDRKFCTVHTLDAVIASVTKCRRDEEDDVMECDEPNSSSDSEEKVKEESEDDSEEDKSNEDTMLDFDANFSDTSFSKSCYKEWIYKEHMKYGGGSGSASLIQMRLTHPKARVFICKQHSRLSLRHDSDKANPWNGCHSMFPLKQIIDSQSTFAARRFVCDRDKSLADLLAKYDIIFLDEAQDIFSGLEMRLLMQSSTPVVSVGDINQSINSFVHQIKDSYCDKRSPCIFPMETADKNMPQQIQWYSTYRLCALTVAFLEDFCGVNMVSKRTDTSVIRWQNKITEPNTLVMARSNHSVLKIAMEYKNDNIRVMGGVRVASILKAASISAGQNSMAKTASKLKQNGQLASMLKFLVAQDISINELKENPTFCVSTIHMLKGFETSNTAVHADVFEAAAKETQANTVDRTDRSVLFVAASRHTRSLTILIDIPEPAKSIENVKVQSTLDLTKFIYSKKN